FNSDVEELPVNTLRRSSRKTKLPTSLNDFIVEGKVKYGVERVVNYANLNHDNYCFISALNKSFEPTCYEEAILDSNWINAMNAKIEALNKNHTWIIVDLPANRKAIRNKCVIALSITNNWPLFQLDVNNAFLYGDLDEDIYMTILKGFVTKDKYRTRYLKGAPGKGIRYKYPDIKDTICGYSDADWAKCLKTRKSVTEAEYRSLSSAACEIIWIQKLLMDLKTKVTLPIDLFCDNKSALQLAINPVFHERTSMELHRLYKEGLRAELINTLP
ncbi:ribonuclease H-like domain-containing protein, partial [Tanacetum coccineum]